jgi:hypothetical protein
MKSREIVMLVSPDMRQRADWLAEALVLDVSRFQSALATLNWAAMQADANQSLISPDVGVHMQRPKVAELLDLFEEAGVLTVDRGRLRFTNETARFFAHPPGDATHGPVVFPGARHLRALHLRQRPQTPLLPRGAQSAGFLRTAKSVTFFVDIEPRRHQSFGQPYETGIRFESANLPETNERHENHKAAKTSHRDRPAAQHGLYRQPGSSSRLRREDERSGNSPSP